LEEKIRKAQETDENLMKIRKHTGENKAPDFRVDDQGTLWYKNRICVPEDGDFRQTIMGEAHNSAYSIHPGSTKMYMDLKQKYWWNGMKADIARFVAHCDTCQRIKAEHQKPARAMPTRRGKKQASILEISLTSRFHLSEGLEDFRCMES
jgi:hypothetical protein